MQHEIIVKNRDGQTVAKLYFNNNKTPEQTLKLARLLYADNKKYIGCTFEPAKGEK